MINFMKLSLRDRYIYNLKSELLSICNSDAFSDTFGSYMSFETLSFYVHDFHSWS